MQFFRQRIRQAARVWESCIFQESAGAPGLRKLWLPLGITSEEIRGLRRLADRIAKGVKGALDQPRRQRRAAARD